MRARQAVWGFLPIALLGAPMAQACSMVAPDVPPTYFERRAYAKETIAKAALIFDGEVVTAGVDGGAPAKVRVDRVLKGEAGKFVDVHGDSAACSLAFDRVGERTRFILFLENGRYYTWVDAEDARIYDRLLKSDRRKPAG